MTVRFLSPARDELREGIRYYDTQRRGLGREFRDEVRAAIDRITGFPTAWHPLSENTRRCLLRRFPYGVIYQVHNDEILVAVAHLHREPEYWSQRAPSA